MRIIDKVSLFYQAFKGEKAIIGYSAYGLPIYSVTVKKSDYPVMIVQSAMHAREHITALLTIKLAQDFLDYAKDGTVHFIPLVNPDGVCHCQSFNPLYKANGRGVDLNVNFPAGWGKGEFNKNVAGASDYVGEQPLSEKESLALYNFTLSVKPNLTLSYHAKGEEIYWEFGQKGYVRMRDRFIANAVADATGYKLKLTPNSSGGYKDWCVQQLKIPSLTIEVGSDELEHPIGEENLDSIYQKNKNVLSVLSRTLLEKRWLKNSWAKR